MPVTQAMLMAAGLGTRLRPFTDHAPKALMPVMGIPAAQFAVDVLLGAGVKRIVANIHHHAEATREGLARLDLSRAPGAELLISDESRGLLGSAGGVKKALPCFNGQPFFLLNADVVCDVDLSALARTHEALHRQYGVLLTLALAPMGPPGGKYAEIFVDGEGRIKGIGPQALGRPFFLGAAVFEPQALAGVPPGLPGETVPLIFQPAIAAGRAGYHWNAGGYGIWKDVGTPALWLDAHLELMDRLETGALPSVWRRRIEARARRVSQGIWIGAEATGHRRGYSGFSSPSFWDGVGKAPRELGPGAVLYGSDSGLANVGSLRGGIGSGGAWVQVTQL
jgi:NDP-sugar pyrophosphorylase family protein